MVGNECRSGYGGRGMGCGAGCEEGNTFEMREKSREIEEREGTSDGGCGLGRAG